MKTYAMYILILAGAFFNEAIAQKAQFKIPIVIKCGPYLDSLWIGISGDGPGGTIMDNTDGLDAGKTFGAPGKWQELMYPPDMPNLTFNAKFVNIWGPRGIIGTGLKPYDFRGYTSRNQVDTFSIRVYGDSVANSPVQLNWPRNLKDYAYKWQLIKRVGTKQEVVVKDMTATTSYREANADNKNLFNFIIVKSGIR